jgi:hypothetical protein
MTELHLAVGLDGYGWHPQAWRYAFARNATGGGQLSGRYWAAVAGTAERGLLDFLTSRRQPGRAVRAPGRNLAAAPGGTCRCHAAGRPDRAGDPTHRPDSRCDSYAYRAVPRLESYCEA